MAKMLLRQGSVGGLVVTLQEALTTVGYPVPAPDGHYTAATREAVEAFQLDAELEPTGVCDAETWKALGF